MIDQISKILIRKYMLLGESLNVIGNYLRFTYVENFHAIFGLNLPIEYFFYPAALISLIFVIYYLRKITSFYLVFLLGLISGGALGNVVDRLIYGSVTDFIDMGISPSFRWYIYNIADAFILIGIILLFIWDFTHKKNQADNE